MAMLTDGLATVTQLTTTHAAKSAEAASAQARFGLSEALSSLLRVGVEAKLAGDSSAGHETARTQEKVHTPASLLHRLSDELRASGRLEPLALTSVSSGSLVEFESLLHRNPVLQGFAQLLEAMKTAILFTDEEPVRKGQHKARSEPPAKRLVEQIEQFIAKLRSGGTVDLVTAPTQEGVRAVLTLEEQYLNDPSMADLAEGQFKVLGKVIRVIRDPGEYLSLLRKTPFGSMTREKTTELLANFESVGAEGTFAIPKMEWAVEAPVVHVLPLAIYA
jgi:hypothetical protein